MRKVILVLVIGFFLSGMLTAQTQTTKPFFIHKAHVKEQKQSNKSLKNGKLNNTLLQQNKKVIHQPKNKVPIDKSVRIQKNAIKTPTEN